MTDLFEQAKQHARAGDSAAAEASYRDLLASEPDHFRAYCNLGCLLEDQGKLIDAQKCQMQAIAIKPDEAFPHYNLGHIFHQQARLEAAVDAYQKAIELGPDMAAAHFNLGKCLHSLGKLEAAAASFEQATRCDTESLPAYTLLAETHKALKHYDAAIEAFQRVLQLDPEEHSVAFQLGRLYQLTQRFSEAEQAYHKVLQLNPLSVSARESLAQLLHDRADTGSALRLLQQGLALQPAQARLLHLQAALSGEDTPARASDDYVATVFDQFAEDFDQVLGELKYQGPDLVHAALTDSMPDARGDLVVADLGCGTGLCGPRLRPYARRLVGVDLSQGMLDKAQQGAVYDELLAMELSAYLLTVHAELDLITAADTLIYFGDLTVVLRAARQALRPGGLLIFTLESLQSGDDPASAYVLHPHGRYSHRRDYLLGALSDADLELVTLKDAYLRTQNGLPVPGFICTARAV